MFDNSEFDQDISDLKLREDIDENRMFMKCPIHEEYKPKALQQK